MAVRLVCLLDEISLIKITQNYSVELPFFGKMIMWKNQFIFLGMTLAIITTYIFPVLFVLDEIRIETTRKVIKLLMILRVIMQRKRMRCSLYAHPSRGHWRIDAASSWTKFAKWLSSATCAKANKTIPFPCLKTGHAGFFALVDSSSVIFGHWTLNPSVKSHFLRWINEFTWWHTWTVLKTESWVGIQVFDDMPLAGYIS